MEKITNKPQTVEVRSAELMDQLAIDVPIDPAVQPKWLEMIAADQLVLFAVHGSGGYLGRVNLWLAEADEEAVKSHFPNVPLVNALEVNEKARGQGVGTQLMLAVEDEVRRRGFKHIGLGVEPDNEKAISLYRRLGYQFRKLGDDDTYTSGWHETKDDGSVQWYEVVTKFMTKDLAD